MAPEDFNETLQRFVNLDYTKVDFEDQLEMFVALTKFIATVKPIVDKYSKDPEAEKVEESVEDLIQKFFEEISKGGSADE